MTSPHVVDAFKCLNNAFLLLNVSQHVLHVKRSGLLRLNSTCAFSLSCFGMLCVHAAHERSCAVDVLSAHLIFKSAPDEYMLSCKSSLHVTHIAYPDAAF